MEFPEVGKRCDLMGCRQLDFLPFHCSCCSGIFCLEHRTHAGHKCPSVGSSPLFVDKVATVCPKCDESVTVLPNEDPEVKIQMHIADGCKSVQKERIKQNKCARRGCRVSQLIPINCNKCRHQYCLKHRHPLDHQCSSMTTTPTTNNNTTPATRNSKTPLRPTVQVTSQSLPSLRAHERAKIAAANGTTNSTPTVRAQA
eukprot:TRINITY_DN854_c3_g1_i1.p1 TRINITY_DN854_c3_g1~~TRINITY_DN854_c3_g1_i1.p1  ORF type:complete len:199 (-),score=31.28 TRINITY_DN854_c3_g1_i1:69-665(-)